ncbi:MAG: ATP-binding protein [Nitrospirota bacterium]
MEDLSLHILDIVENSIEAGADRIEVIVTEDIQRDTLIIEIKDNGRGIDNKTLKKVFDPFFTTRKTRRVGLGLSLIAQAAKESGGDIAIKSKKAKGTTLTVTFQYSHIDRKPLGNMVETLIVLIAANPEIDFLYKHVRDNNSYIFDTRKIKRELRGIPINTPDTLISIRMEIEEGLKSLG